MSWGQKFMRKVVVFLFAVVVGVVGVAVIKERLVFSEHSRRAADSLLAFIDEDIKGLEKDKIALKREEIALEMAGLLLQKQAIPFYSALKKWGAAGSLSILGLCGLIVALSKYKRDRVHRILIYGNDIAVHERDLKDATAYVQGMETVKKMEALGMAEERRKELLLAMAQNIGDRLGALPEGVANMSLMAGAPTFRELLQQGEIGKGKELIAGFSEDGRPVRVPLEDSYSAVIIGKSGSGKTSGEAYKIASSILAYGAAHTILDPHYPDRKQESLGDRLGPLVDLPNVRIFSNPLSLSDIVAQLTQEFETHKSMDSGPAPHIIVIDEQKVWISSTNGGKELLDFEEKMIYEGRKYGWYLHCTSKSGKAEAFGSTAVRDNFVTSLVYKTKDLQAKTFYKDRSVSDLVKQCKKPGQAVFTDITDFSQVVQVPFCAVEDMQTVYKMVSGGAALPSISPASPVSFPKTGNAGETVRPQAETLETAILDDAEIRERLRRKLETASYGDVNRATGYGKGYIKNYLEGKKGSIGLKKALCVYLETPINKPETVINLSERRFS